MADDYSGGGSSTHVSESGGTHGGGGRSRYVLKPSRAKGRAYTYNKRQVNVAIAKGTYRRMTRGKSDDDDYPF